MLIEKIGGTSDMNILITGGAGFIGTHLTKELLLHGHTVGILDLFSEQIHGHFGQLRSDIVDDVELFRGDVCDPELVAQALLGREVVVHLAAETGTSQSMYEVQRYEKINLGGTAAILDYLVNNPNNKLKRIVLASSRAIYGEGKYICKVHGHVYPSGRLQNDLERSLFETRCTYCGEFCEATATDEQSTQRPGSFYGLTKQVQEQMITLFAKTTGLSVISLRYQNVFGPGQSLHNPYTGILSIFSNISREGRLINVFEDGLESRDFVYISDVIDATCRAVEYPGDIIENLNVGSGVRTSVLQVAMAIRDSFGSRSQIEVTGQYRIGDIRHNFADISRAKEVLGFVPNCNFAYGIERFVEWVGEQPVSGGRYDASLSELSVRGLLRGKRI